MITKSIPSKLYGEILKSLPVLCVDVVVKTKKGVLLCVRFRKGNPGKGLKWLIGGRVLHGELLEDAVIRKVKEETGLKVKVVKRVGVYTVFSKVQDRHNVAINYLAEQIGGKLTLNDEYSSYIFINKIDGKLHPYVRAVLSDSGVFGKSKPSNAKYYTIKG